MVIIKINTEKDNIKIIRTQIEMLEKVIGIKVAAYKREEKYLEGLTHK